MIALTTTLCAGALAGSHDARLVVLSIVVAMVASFTALTFVARARSARTRNRREWLAVAAFALGGGIWTMHFVGMLAFRLPIAIAYDPALTVLSLLVAVAAICAGFAVVELGRATNESVLAAGIVVGVGVAIMHYVGMRAMNLAAQLVYDVTLASLSLLVALAAATAAIAIAWKVRRLVVRAAASLLMAAAIASVHYISMEAVQIVPDTSAQLLPDGLDRFTLGTVIAASFLIGAALSLLAVWGEHRLAAHEASVIRRRDRRFQALAQHTMVLTLLIDEAGVVQFEIGPTEKLLGVASGSLQGARLAERVAGIEPIFVILNLLRAGVGAIQRDIDLTHPDGRNVTIEVTMQDQRDQADLHGFLLQMHDVTDARRNAQILAEARDEAERANRAKTEFLGNISHELRTPIHICTGYAQMLRDYADDLAGEQVREYAQEIFGANERLMQTVSDLIALSQLEAADDVLEADAIGPRNLLQQQARQLAATAEAAQITIEIAASNIPAIFGDERRLAYALTHLVRNAIKFSPAGAPVELSACVEQGEMWLTVADRGVGMTEDDIARAVESFTQLDGSHSRVAEGLGLGLAIARRVAERHGGRLVIASTEGVGTRVSIVLPGARVLRATAAAAAA